MKLLKACFIVLIMLLLSGCVEEDKKMPTSTPIQTSYNENKNTIKEISENLNMLKSSGWNDLATQLGRPKTTTVLWYHLKKRFDVAPKLVLGRRPNKLNTTIAILVKNKTDDYPTVTIKRVEYYVIDPTVPEIIPDFEYGDMFDDPGNNYLYDKFRLKKEDTEIIEEWMNKTGVSIEYTDFRDKI